MNPGDTCTPVEELALERLAEDLLRIRRRHRMALTMESDVALSDLNGELLAIAGELGPEVVTAETRDVAEFAKAARGRPLL